MSPPIFAVITGPTAVGKTEFVEVLSTRLTFPIEVINADMGQLYTPLIIGTAKPDLSVQKIPHHLFNVLNSPQDFTVSRYREKVLEVITQITNRKTLPVIVGGSSFYLASLFYPPVAVNEETVSPDIFAQENTNDLWEALNRVDSQRAEQIHRNDRYRITRALTIWHNIGLVPSQIKPVFNPLGLCSLYFLTRDKEDLAQRIKQRTSLMLNAGWMKEVQELPQHWKDFLLSKKIIGYPEIISYIEQREIKDYSDDAFEHLVERIESRTRGYAKRQITYWKKLKSQLLESDPKQAVIKYMVEMNLTLSPIDLYLEQIIKQLENLYTSMYPDRDR